MAGVTINPGFKWKDTVFKAHKSHLLDMLREHGDNAMNWINEMQSNHAIISGNAGPDYLTNPYTHDNVRIYQKAFKLGYDGTDFNTLGIANAYRSGAFSSLGNSGDNPNMNYNPDGMFSGITSWRYLIGKQEDFNENDNDFKEWKTSLNSIGYDTWLDKDGYYKIRKLNPSNLSNENTPGNIPAPNPSEGGYEDTTPGNIPDANEGRIQGLEEPTKKFRNTTWLNTVLPNLFSATRLGLNLWNNSKVSKYYLKAALPLLKGTSHTYNQVTGDEGLKQSFYTKGAQQISRAALPFTSDSDRLTSYMMLALNNANQLKILGDLADNAEIKRTSALSKLDADANALRDSDVANLNRSALHEAMVKRQEIKALRAARDTESWDNYLQGLEAKVLENRDKKLKLAQLLFQHDIANDPTHEYLLNALYLAMTNAKGETLFERKRDPQVRRALQDLDNYLRERQIGFLRRNYLFYKKGGPIKMLQGGGIPFRVYTPTAVGGGQSTTTTASSSSTSKSKDNPSKDMFIAIKELFKEVEGLPNDVSYIQRGLLDMFWQISMGGEDMDYTDLASMYVSFMNKVSNLKYHLKAFDLAHSYASGLKALGEYAVDASGRVIAQNRKTLKLESVSLEKLLEGNYVPLTNLELLNFRASSPTELFDSTYLEAVNNATSLSKISEYLKSSIMTLGTNELLLEGYAKKEADTILGGIEALKSIALSNLSGSVDGIYKETFLSKDLQVLANFAIRYLKSILSPSQLTILKLHGDPDLLIADMITSRQSLTLHYNFDAVTGRAAKDSNGNSKEAGIPINSAVKLLLGLGNSRMFTFNIGNGNSFDAFGRVSSINDSNGAPFGADFPYSEIYNSELRNNLDFDNATFGDIPINKAFKDRIIVDNSTIVGVDLPYIRDKSGRIIPDFQLLNRIEEADKEVLRRGIDPEKDPEGVNKVYTEFTLPVKFKGENRLSDNYKRFVFILATAIEDVLLNKEGISSNGTLTLVTDDNEIEEYLRKVKEVTKEKKISLDKPWSLSDKNIYKGSMFIPIIGDITDAMTGSKDHKLTSDNFPELLDRWNTRNYNAPPNINKNE